jgi:hypothetical protein
LSRRSACSRSGINPAGEKKRYRGDDLEYADDCESTAEAQDQGLVPDDGADRGDRLPLAVGSLATIGSVTAFGIDAGAAYGTAL